MKRLFTATALLVGLIVLFAGCENPFSGNVFASFATPVAPEGAADIEAIVAMAALTHSSTNSPS